MSLELVAVKDFKGALLCRWIVEIGASVAYITNEQGAKAMEAGGVAEYVVGFPKFDVFRGTEDTRTLNGQFVDWGRFKPRF